MVHSDSWWHFLQFRAAVTRRGRHMHDRQTKSFLAAVLQAAGKHVHVIRAGTRLWRAQLGNEWVPPLDGINLDSEARPFREERMKPPRKSATEGRANRKGTPSVLYLATTRKTAIGEVRPWKEAYVSVGIFELDRELRIADCTATSGPILDGSEASVEKQEEEIWACVGDAFTHPVTANDSSADYAHTQIIAEFLKVQRFDGIQYRSLLGTGRNIVLFDRDAAKLKMCQLFRVKNVTFPSCKHRDPEYY